MADTEFPTVLGPDVTFKGELSFEKAVRIQGTFEGEVKSPGVLHIDREANFSGDVKAGHIRVDGTVRGNLSAGGKIELRQSSDHEGDLQAAKLVVEEGAVFKGHVSVGPAAGKQPPQPEPQVNLRNGLVTNN